MKPATLYVCHGMFGCETGCCGYRLCLDDEGDEEYVGEDAWHFGFAHPRSNETPDDYARRQWPTATRGVVQILPGKWYPGSCA